MIVKKITLGALFTLCLGIGATQAQKSYLIKNVNIIDGTGAPEQKESDVLIHGKYIAEVGKDLPATGAEIIDGKGKTVLPALISTHVHIGSLKGLTNKAENYTRDNILSQLNKYQSYGVEDILVMGSDRPMMFESGLRDSSAAGLLPGAKIFSAGYGFGLPAGAPPVEFAMDNVYRPTDPDQIPAEMDSLVKLNPFVVKLWVDDFNGKYKAKMSPAIYKRIIEEAHKRNLKVAAHVYYLNDLRNLVNDGVDIIGHSVRDSIIDDATIADMKAKNVTYIPTLSLDEFAYIYSRKPEWINNEFFKASLEPGVYEMITSKAYQDKIGNAPGHERDKKAFETALKNLKKVYDAGIFVSFGTDSGAMPLRAQGFSEHLELQLMTEAGLTPIEAIKVATLNAATLLKIDKETGSIQKGKLANLILVNGNPGKKIKDTRNIDEVWKNGEIVSHGPLKK